MLPSVFGYYEKQELSLFTKDVRSFFIDAGAGFLKVKCIDNTDKINVYAEIIIENVSEKKAKEYIDKYMKLTLSYENGDAVLKSYFDHNNSFWKWLEGESFSGYINLVVEMPSNLFLRIDDGSGYLSVDNLKNNLEIDDGSGDILLANIKGNMRIDDGSGGLNCVNCSGKFYLDDGSGDTKIIDSFVDGKIDDGSGDLSLMNCSGKLYIDDGSEDIKIVASFLDIKIDDGSGDINIMDNKGNVYIDDGSGFVNAIDIDGDLTVSKSNIEDVAYENIAGKVYIIDD